MKVMSLKKRQRLSATSSPGKIGWLSMDAVMEKAAERFVAERISHAINEATGYWVMVEVPGEAYTNLNMFLECCKKYIPAGYIVKISHDGGGMYNTLAVGWEPENSKNKC